MNSRARSLFQDEDPQILQATQWLLRLCDEGAGAEEIAAWQKWLAASPAHRASFERAQAIWEHAALLDPIPWPTDREVAEDLYDASVPVSRARSSSRQVRWRALAMAAALSAVAIGVTILWHLQQAAHTLSTRTGENRTFVLTDRSRVSLGGASRLRWSIDAQHRALELQSGEAFFEVAKDPQRPFVVRAGDARITAVGTAFNVRRTMDRVQIAVTSGAVKLAANAASSLPFPLRETRLEAGYQAVIVGGAVLPPAPAEVPAVMARKRGQLRYAAEPLRYVVADLSRYSTVPIEIRDSRAGNLLVTSTVLENDLNGWLQGLEKALPVDVAFNEDQIVITAR